MGVGRWGGFRELNATRGRGRDRHGPGRITSLPLPDSVTCSHELVQEFRRDRDLCTE